MIKLEDIKDGMKVWTGWIIFNTSSRGSSVKLSKTAYSCLEPLECTLKIVSQGNGSKAIKLTPIEDTNNYAYIPPIQLCNYGSDMRSSVYATKQDVEDDWNMVVRTELIKRQELFLKSQELIEDTYIKK